MRVSLNCFVRENGGSSSTLLNPEENFTQEVTILDNYSTKTICAKIRVLEVHKNDCKLKYITN